jgi:hypothetical protein
VCLVQKKNGYEPDEKSDEVYIKKNLYSIFIILSIIGGSFIVGMTIYVLWKCNNKKELSKYELKEDPFLKSKVKDKANRLTDRVKKVKRKDNVLKFEEFEKILR